MALAPADNAVLGRHLHHDAVALGHGADAQRYLPLLGHAEARGVGFDVDDFHFRAPIIRIVADAPPANPGVHPKERRTMRLASRKVFAGNFRNFRKRYANQGYGMDPLGETAKLRTVPRAEFLQGG